jgi:hypothetical protein
MSPSSSAGYAFNRTRNKPLADHVALADSHWSRFRGLMLTDARRFGAGRALWIVPSRGVHTFAMRFPIDVLYLDDARRVVHLEIGLKPWRVAPVSLKTASVLELPVGCLLASGTAIGDEIEIGVGQLQGGGNGTALKTKGES